MQPSTNIGEEAMHAAMISYKESFDGEMMEILKALNINSYTKLPQVMDKSEKGRPKLGTHIFPGFNSVLLLTIEEDKKDFLFKKLKEFNEEHKFDKIKAYCWKVEECIFD